MSNPRRSAPNHRWETSRRPPDGPPKPSSCWRRHLYARRMQIHAVLYPTHVAVPAAHFQGICRSPFRWPLAFYADWVNPDEWLGSGAGRSRPLCASLRNRSAAPPARAHLVPTSLTPSGNVSLRFPLFSGMNLAHPQMNLWFWSRPGITLVGNQAPDSDASQPIPGTA